MKKIVVAILIVQSNLRISVYTIEIQNAPLVESWFILIIMRDKPRAILRKRNRSLTHCGDKKSEITAIASIERQGDTHQARNLKEIGFFPFYGVIYWNKSLMSTKVIPFRNLEKACSFGTNRGDDIFEKAYSFSCVLNVHHKGEHAFYISDVKFSEYFDVDIVFLVVPYPSNCLEMFGVRGSESPKSAISERKKPSPASSPTTIQYLPGCLEIFIPSTLSLPSNLANKNNYLQGKRFLMKNIELQGWTRAFQNVSLQGRLTWVSKNKKSKKDPFTWDNIDFSTGYPSGRNVHDFDNYGMRASAAVNTTASVEKHATGQFHPLVRQLVFPPSDYTGSYEKCNDFHSYSLHNRSKGYALHHAATESCQMFVEKAEDSIFKAHWISCLNNNECCVYTLYGQTINVAQGVAAPTETQQNQDQNNATVPALDVVDGTLPELVASGLNLQGVGEDFLPQLGEGITRPAEDIGASGTVTEYSTNYSSNNENEISSGFAYSARRARGTEYAPLIGSDTAAFNRQLDEQTESNDSERALGFNGAGNETGATQSPNASAADTFRDLPAEDEIPLDISKSRRLNEIRRREAKFTQLSTEVSEEDASKSTPALNRRRANAPTNGNRRISSTNGVNPTSDREPQVTTNREHPSGLSARDNEAGASYIPSQRTGQSDGGLPTITSRGEVTDNFQFHQNNLMIRQVAGNTDEMNNFTPHDIEVNPAQPSGPENIINTVSTPEVGEQTDESLDSVIKIKYA